MGRLCRLKTKTHGDDGLWAYNEIQQLRTTIAEQQKRIAELETATNESNKRLYEEREIWDGYRYGPKAAKSAFGFDAAFSIEQLDKKLPELLVDRDTLWHAVGHDAGWDARIAKALNEVRAQARAGKRAPRAIHDLRAELDAMRLIKDEAELAIMQRAANIASAGHARAMRACRPGMAEYELEAELSYEFRKRGADGHAYTPIVAGGANACVLHYVSNDKLLNDHTLVLIDAGCEVEGYAADITRTFPVNGRFTPAQKDVYEIVLAAQAAAFTATAPVVTSWKRTTPPCAC